jgi:hypothetical protein
MLGRRRIISQLLLGILSLVPDASEVGRVKLAQVHALSQSTCGLFAHGLKASIVSLDLSRPSEMVTPSTRYFSSVAGDSCPRGAGHGDLTWLAIEGHAALDQADRE